MTCRLKTACLLFSLFAWAPTASAEPLLQLDIAGGTYDTATHTVTASGDSFTLYALLTPKEGTSEEDIEQLLAGTYYLAIALVPQTGPAAESLGSFDVNSTTVAVTADMTYGTPPLEVIPELQTSDGHDLGSHDIYETFFLEVPFTFSSTQTATTYNVETAPGSLVSNPDGGTYYMQFAIDMGSLDPSYTLHFDLYDTTIAECGAKKKAQGQDAPCPDVDVDSFAPFSHDASGPPDRELPPPVPEPASAILFGVSLGAAGLRRWLRR